MIKNMLLRSCAALALSTPMAVPALAQTAPATSQDSAANPSSTPAPPEAQTPERGSTAAPSSTAGGQSGLNDIIVTGAPTVGGLRKLDTGFTATTMSNQQIRELHPITSADLLKVSPGVFVESTGGQVGANVEVVGFPSNGGTPYATLQLNGAALFPMAQQSNLPSTDLIRLDETVQRVELIQGGPGVLYGQGQPGLTANYILKQGTDQTAGSLGFTYGSGGGERVDGFVGGAISKSAGLYGTIGGYWYRSDGVKDPQYTAEREHQITATLAKRWTNGSLMVYGRYQKDQDQYVTDTPFILNGPGNFQRFPGFSPLTGSQGSKADQHELLQVSPCTGAGCSPGTQAINMANGRGPTQYVVGGTFNWDFGNGLQLQDSMNYVRGTQHMNAFYSSGINPTALSTYIGNQEKTFKIPATATVRAFYTTDGSAADLNQQISTQELRYVDEKYHNFSNELRLSYEVFPGNTVTVGDYVARYGIDLLQYSGAKMLLQAKSNPTPIGVDLTSGGTVYHLASGAGFVNGPTGSIHNTGETLNNAFFLSDTWKVGRFLFDAGIRRETQTFDEHVGNTASGSLSGDPTQLYNSSANYLTPGSQLIHYNKSGISWTVGLNYRFSDNSSAYVRVNKGVHFPAFSDLTLTLPDIPLQTARNYQGGVKFQNKWIYLDVSGFYRQFRNVSNPPAQYLVPGTNITERGTFAYGANTYGVQYQVTLNPFENFTLSATGDYARGTYNHSTGCIVFEGLVNTVACNASFQYNGYLLTRQPLFQTRVTPAYTLDTSWGSLKAYATIEFVGKHWADFQQLQPLPSYYSLALGINARIGEHWELNLYGTNVTNQVGLTEDNATGVPAETTILARSMDGREVAAQVRFKF
ncbi:TonB-dependent receptor [Sphingomonas bacterium]|uniref:TonB-dependent receptor n=1 Tax=Sphingomonas bacterium TaxID=1895847 RepID=UPI00157604C6|nr:TonB-dependent receptor [Sphingomonas bacterium]